MDWASERHVRLYCRDTATWQCLGFAGQCMVMQLLRVLDEQGCLDLGDLEPWEFATQLFGAPPDFARDGIGQALRLGVVALRGRQLVMPNFVMAQGASKSGAQRMRELRARKRDAALRNVTPFQSEPVLPSNGIRDVTNRNRASRDVTRGDARLQNVTSHTGLNGSSLPAPYEDDPNQVLPGANVPWVQMLKLWERAALNGLPCGEPRAHRVRLEALWVACLARDAADPLSVFKRAAEAYCAVQQGRRRTPQLRWFASDFESYADNHAKGRRSSPLIKELQAAQKLRAEAVRAKDADAVARLDLELAGIGKRMTGHV